MASLPPLQSGGGDSVGGKSSAVSQALSSERASDADRGDTGMSFSSCVFVFIVCVCEQEQEEEEEEGVLLERRRRRRRGRRRRDKRRVEEREEGGGKKSGKNSQTPARARLATGVQSIDSVRASLFLLRLRTR